MLTDHMRIAAFRLPASDLGTVYGYPIDEPFASRWEALRIRWQQRDERRQRYRYVQLPYAALAHALCVLSGDFVTCQRRVQGGNYLFLSRRAIAPAPLRRVLAAWELCLGEPEPGALSSLVGDLAPVQVSLADLVCPRRGASPVFARQHGWAWSVAHWAVAHQLAALPLEFEGQHVPLRLDSDARLLTWDSLIGPEQWPDRAMHVVNPKIITVPGIEEFVVHLHTHLVRLASNWDESRSAHAWAELPNQTTILRAAVGRRPPDGARGWTSYWKDDTAELLARCALDGPPNIDNGPQPNSRLRAGFRRSPRAAKIGRGVGPWFYEHLTHHARASMPDAAPLEMTRIKSPRRSVHTLAPAVSLQSASTTLRILAVYHDAQTRQRQRDGLLATFPEVAENPGLVQALTELEDQSMLSLGPIEVVFVQPPDSACLVDREQGVAWAPWLDTWLPELINDTTATAALIETNESFASGERDRDPKHILRSLLAQRGVVSQFISQTSAPRIRPGKPKPTDHAAQGAVLDLLRSAGWFLKEFPAAGVAVGTFLIGVYCVQSKVRQKGGRIYHFVNLVAVQAGQVNALGFDFDEGWVPLHRATARFLATEHNNDAESARDLVEDAVDRFRAQHTGTPIVLVFDAFGCRRHWRVLGDAGADLSIPPWMTKAGTAVVRIRAEEQEVPRPAGSGDWSRREPARYTDHRLMRLDGIANRTPAFLFSGSAPMSRTSTLRVSTRFTCDDRSLGQDWHALGTTEIHVLDPGKLDREALEIQIASMCRVGPSWGGQLRWPSPLHLARAVVRDHPRCLIASEDDGDLDDER